MDDRLPKLKGSVVFHENGTDIVATDLQSGKNCTVSRNAAAFVRQLDGFQEPQEIPSPLTKAEINELIECFDQLGFFRERRMTVEPRATLRLMLWERNVSEDSSAPSRWVNILLVIMWLPLLFAGLCAALSKLPQMSFDILWLGLVFGIVGSAFFHEIGHVLSALAYGASVCEVGFMLKLAVLPSVYVLIDDSEVKKRMHRIQIALGGAEANFAVAGVSMLLAAMLPALGGMFLLSALVNVIFALLNLTLLSGSDGTCVLEEVLGVEDLMKKAGIVVKNRKIRRRILKQGIYGAGAVAMCYILWIVKIVLPIILLSNIVEVIVCFV